MHYPRRMDIFQSSQYLIEEVLDELLLEWAGSEKAVQIGAEEFSDEIAGRRGMSVCLSWREMGSATYPRAER